MLTARVAAGVRDLAAWCFIRGLGPALAVRTSEGVGSNWHLREVLPVAPDPCAAGRLVAPACKSGWRVVS